MSERLAVLDLGSNAVRLILATVTPGVDFRVLRQERVQTRLADHRRGLLPRAAVDQTLKAVSRFLAEVRQGSSPRVLAVATAAIRDAPNADRLLAALRREEGVKVRVLSGLEEAGWAPRRFCGGGRWTAAQSWIWAGAAFKSRACTPGESRGSPACRSAPCARPCDS